MAMSRKNEEVLFMIPGRVVYHHVAERYRPLPRAKLHGAIFRKEA
jgi:hypothetical protein